MNRLTDAVNRREFLQAAVAGLGGLALSAAAGRLRAAEAVAAALNDAKPGDPKDAFAAQVFEIHEPRLLDQFGNIRDLDYLPGVVHRLLREMAGCRRTRDAWHAFFSDRDVIGIKFNPIAAEALRTSGPMARMLIRSLLDAGFIREKIMLIDGPQYTGGFKLRPPPFGYEEQAVAVGQDRRTHLVRALGQVTAILNVPFIKDHRQVGLSCATVNLALGLVNNPGAFTDHGGVPGVVDLFALEAIRSKHRLTLVNAIRGIYDGGPRAGQGKMWNQHAVVGGTDCIAVDRVALDLLDAARFSRGLKGLAEAGRDPKYLSAAAERGLGVADLPRIHVRRVSI